MEICNSKEELISSKPLTEMKNQSHANNDIVLCEHCKRTSSNGIRCIGMCVADNDY